MKLSGREDVEAPISAVFSTLTDYAGWERAAMRRGAEVQRIDTLAQPGRGMAWTVGFAFRGKARRARLEFVEYEPQVRLAVSGLGANLDGLLTVDLIEMSARRTRMEVRLQIRPLSLGARLLVQSLRLARARAERRFRTRIAQVAAEIEQRHARGVA